MDGTLTDTGILDDPAKQAALRRQLVDFLMDGITEDLRLVSTEEQGALKQALTLAVTAWLWDRCSDESAAKLAAKWGL